MQRFDEVERALEAAGFTGRALFHASLPLALFDTGTYVRQPIEGVVRMLRVYHVGRPGTFRLLSERLARAPG